MTNHKYSMPLALVKAYTLGIGGGLLIALGFLLVAYGLGWVALDVLREVVQTIKN